MPRDQEGRKRSHAEVRFNSRTTQQQQQAHSSSEDEDDDDAESESQESPQDASTRVSKENLRYLMKRPSYGDILQTLQPSDLNAQQMSESMSVIIAAANARQQQDAVAAAMASQPSSIQMQVMAAQAAAAAATGATQFFPVPYGSGPMMVPPNMPAHTQPRLNKQEEVEMAKKERRLQKNREAAKECRRKKKEYIKSLEDRIRVLEQQNLLLSNELSKPRGRLALPTDMGPGAFAAATPSVALMEGAEEQLLSAAAVAAAVASAAAAAGAGGGPAGVGVVGAGVVGEVAK